MSRAQHISSKAWRCMLARCLSTLTVRVLWKQQMQPVRTYLMFKLQPCGQGLLFSGLCFLKDKVFTIHSIWPPKLPLGFADWPIWYLFFPQLDQDRYRALRRLSRPAVLWPKVVTWSPLHLPQHRTVRCHQCLVLGTAILCPSVSTVLSVLGQDIQN